MKFGVSPSPTASVPQIYTGNLKKRIAWDRPFPASTVSPVVLLACFKTAALGTFSGFLSVASIQAGSPI